LSPRSLLALKLLYNKLKDIDIIIMGCKIL